MYALDALTGEVRWTFDPQVSRANIRAICCDIVNRGVALYKGKVYVGTLDGRLVALDEQIRHSGLGYRHRRRLETLRYHRCSTHRERHGSHWQRGGGVRCARLCFRLRRGNREIGVAHLYGPGRSIKGFEPRPWKMRRNHGTGPVGRRVGVAPFGKESSMTPLDLVYSGTGNGTTSTAICAALAEGTISISPRSWPCVAAPASWSGTSR